MSNTDVGLPPSFRKQSTVNNKDNNKLILVDEVNSCVDLTDELWDRVLGLYLKVYRGPNAAQELQDKLKGYQVLTRQGILSPGRYVRYLPRGILGELRRGGWVQKCNSKTIRLRDASGRRIWRVSRAENYVFVLKEDQNIQRFHKSRIRMLAEEALRADTAAKESAVRLRATFKE